MNDKKDWIKLLKEKCNLKNLKKDQLFILLLVGLLLCVIVFPTDEKKEVKQEIIDNTQIPLESERNEKNDYGDTMEQRLKDTLSYVEGVGTVKVMITMKDSGETVVEKDMPESSNTVSETDSTGGTRTTIEHSSDEETVYSQSEDGSNIPFIIKNVKPEIEGILVVAQGGDDSLVVKKICDAVLALFPVEIHKIKVVKMIE